MYDDPKRYENDGLYEDEDTEYEDEYEYEADDSDYIVDDEDEEDENALWDDAEEDTADDDDTEDPPEKKRKKKEIFADSDADAEDAEAEEYEKTRRRLAKEQRIIDEIEADAAENPIEDDSDDAGDEQPERKSEDALCFPDTLNDVLTRQERKGDFIDTIFYCPYNIHELVTDADMSVILRELNEDHKFLLFLSALRQYSSVKIAAIREQSDRNIRKVRNTMLKKIRKKLLAALTEKVQAQQPLTLLEKEFLSENGVYIEKCAKK